MDLQKLVVRLKEKGLDSVEETIKIVAKETLGWLQEELMLSSNKYVKMLAMVIPMIEGPVMEAVDKIDGEVG